jgi:proteasome lid subunit RPN8/RPN11
MFDEMTAHAVAGLPNEACGLIAGEDGEPVRLYPMRNAEESPVVYRFDDQEQLEVFSEVERKGWSLLGFFHSHTHTDAFPSPTDVARAHWTDPVTQEQVPAFPDTTYLILSLRDRDRPHVRAFHFRAGDPVEEKVTIE